jgi:VanZ family protein
MSYLSNHIRQYKFTAIITIIITIVSLMNESNIPSTGWLAFKNSDKVVHIIMYMTLSYVLFLERNQKRYLSVRHHKIPNFVFMIILIIMGGVIEIIQPIVSNRSCNLLDFLANGIGAILGFLLFKYTHRLLKL